MVVLKLEGGVIVQVVSQPERRAVPPPDDRTIGGITIDGFRNSCIHVRITKIGTVLAESPGELSIEAWCMEYSEESGSGPGMPYQHALIQEFVVRICENEMHG